jgi:hypothetical protein
MKDGMQPRLIVDSAVLMNPLSFAVHLGAFAEPAQPLGIAVASLWEEFDRRYSLISLADTILWFRNDLDRCLAQPLHVSQYAVPDATLALLFAATHLGIARPTCTSHSMAFFRQGHWQSYLSDSLGDKWQVLEVDKSLGNACWQIALRQTSAETGESIERIEEFYDVVFRRLANKTYREFEVADRARTLSIGILEALAGLCFGTSLSTPDPLLRDLLLSHASSADLFVPPKQLPFQPMIERVAVHRETSTVRDIISIVELRRLATLLDGAEHMIEVLTSELAKRDLAKDSALFVLGLVPIVDKVVSAIEGGELVRRLWRARNDLVRPDAEHLLYWSSSTIQGRSQDAKGHLTRQ